MDKTTITERAWVDAAAEEYRANGYEVLREPKLDFAPGIRADLVVRKGDERKVIEVKARSSLNKDVSKLAGLVRSQPGWTFELFLLGEDGRRDLPEPRDVFARDDVVPRIDQAQRAADAGLAEAAFLLAWSACEAAVRALLAAAGANDGVAERPDGGFDHAVYLGLISREEYERLMELRLLRNGVAHGLRVDGLDDGAVSELIAMARDMTSEDYVADDDWPSLD